VIADPSGAGRWAENGVNLVLAGAAWVLADSLLREKKRAAAVNFISSNDKALDAGQ
jgi:hypothetical protein